MKLLANILLANILLAGCAITPPAPPEVRTQVVEVKVPVPIPCFLEDERPILPPPSAIDIDNATVDQLGAALAADAEALDLYTKIVDALFLKCSKGGTK